MTKWTIGSDPEFVLVDSNGYVRSAIDRVPSKESPLVFSNGGSLFADNVLVELNIPPADTMLKFIASIRTTLSEAVATVSPERLLVKSSLAFPPEECDDDRASLFGCTPEFCAWGDNREKILHVSPPMIRPGNTFRSCGGHIHIGHPDCLAWPTEVVRALDLIVSIPSVLIDSDPSSKGRRSIYGGAGCFRPTTYGLEYRTPSSFWLLTPEYAAIMYRLCRLAVKFFRTLVPHEVRSIINEHDKNRAWSLWIDIVKPLLLEESATSLVDAIELLATRTVTPQSLYDSWDLKYGRADQGILAR
jgi:Phage phiEco32-like COOH.NH2 ligase-type 2